MPGMTERIDAEAIRACGQIKAGIDELVRQVREDIVNTNDPRARALFETTAEVLAGLKVAYIHYEAGVDPAFPPAVRDEAIREESAMGKVEQPPRSSAPPQGDSGGTILGES